MRASYIAIYIYLLYFVFRQAMFMAQHTGIVRNGDIVISKPPFLASQRRGFKVIEENGKIGYIPCDRGFGGAIIPSTTKDPFTADLPSLGGENSIVKGYSKRKPAPSDGRQALTYHE